MSYFRTRQAFDIKDDLKPAIGSKGDDGGWCLVKHRVKKNYSSGYKALDKFLMKNKNIDRYDGKSSIEQGAYNIIRFTPTGDEKKYFKTIQIEPHGQMMMDFRGVTLKNVQKAVEDFLPLYEKYMKNNYVRNSAGKFVLVQNPINSGTMKPCSDSAKKRSDVPPKDCFQIEKFNVRYVFAVEGENPSAKEPYEWFNTLLLITAHATYPHNPKDGFGCDDNTGDVITSFGNSSSSSWGGGGITFVQQQKRKASIQRVARLYIRSKFDQ